MEFLRKIYLNKLDIPVESLDKNCPVGPGQTGLVVTTTPSGFLKVLDDTSPATISSIIARGGEDYLNRTLIVPVDNKSHLFASVVAVVSECQNGEPNEHEMLFDEVQSRGYVRSLEDTANGWEVLVKK